MATGTINTSSAKKIPDTTYDNFLGKKVNRDGQPPVKGDPQSFEIVSDQLGNYLSEPQIALISRVIGAHVIYSIDKNVYRAKLSPDEVTVSDTTIKFSLVLDQTNSKTYVIAMTSDATASTLTSATMTSPDGSIVNLLEPSGISD
jgi:hypothetical protein